MHNNQFTWECERQADFEERLKQQKEVENLQIIVKKVDSVPPSAKNADAIQGPSSTKDTGALRLPDRRAVAPLPSTGL